MPTQTYFCEDTGFGNAYDGAGTLLLFRCTRAEWDRAPGYAPPGHCCLKSFSPIYRRVDNGQEMVWDDMPPGATRLDPEEVSCFQGPDGFSYVVKLPDGRDWSVDGPCNNCTRKGEKHYCWVRTGSPKLCNVTVGKGKLGESCSAGAGSIQSYKYENGKSVPSYHGFLQNGILTP